MSTTSSLASKRIESLLDENSFVEIGALVTARATDFNLKQAEKSVSVGISARPPPQLPKTAVICGITPDASVCFK